VESLLNKNEDYDEYADQKVESVQIEKKSEKRRRRGERPQLG
jgi:hypothetical protein